LHEVIGSRQQVPFDASTLRRLVPDIATCDVYVCGPGGFSERVVAMAIRLGVPRDRIHEEVFAF
jgi:ferredoxin-NADP reductase